MARRRARSSRPTAEGTPALMVVDMLRGFLDESAPLYCGADARKVIPYVAGAVRRHARARRPVVFVCDTHEPDDPEFRMWPAHCVKGTWEAEIAPELPVPPAALVVHKTRYDPFVRSDLDRLLSGLAISRFDVVGVCTDICVQYTVAALRFRDYPVRVLQRGVAAMNRTTHERALCHMVGVLGATLG